MKKRIFLLVTVSAILIPSASTECEQGELDARYECCAETDASIEDIVLIAPDTEYEPESMRVDAEDTWIAKEYQKYCETIGQQYNICPELLMAMIEQESSGEAKVINEAGDTGLLQVNAKWHRDSIWLNAAISYMLLRTDQHLRVSSEAVGVAKTLILIV